MGRKERRVKLAEHNDPINYTCGICRQVHVFDAEKPFVCPDVDEVIPDGGI